MSSPPGKTPIIDLGGRRQKKPETDSDDSESFSFLSTLELQKKMRQAANEKPQDANVA